MEQLARVKTEQIKIEDELAIIELVCSLNSHKSEAQALDTPSACVCKNRIRELRELLQCCVHAYTQLQTKLDSEKQIDLEKQRKQAEMDIDDILSICD